MPPPLLLDLDSNDLSKTLLDADEIYKELPQRHEFQLLHGVTFLDDAQKVIAAYRDIGDDDWWVRGHVPGRPLLPGVLMLEMAAQASALMVKVFGGFNVFIGFGGVNNCKFRDSVQPGVRLLLLAQATDIRRRRIVSQTQGVVGGKLIFEAEITGLVMH